ncbi:uncharacterized protein METZ01_LOCUS252271, partial [marine metagenome]
MIRKGKVVGGDLFQYICRFGKQVLFVCSDVPGSFRAVVFSEVSESCRQGQVVIAVLLWHQRLVRIRLRNRITRIV